MDVDEEIDSKKKLVQKKKRSAKTVARSPEVHVHAAGHSEQAQRRVAAGVPRY